MCPPGPMSTLEVNAAVPHVIREEGRFCVCDQRSMRIRRRRILIFYELVLVLYAVATDVPDS